MIKVKSNVAKLYGIDGDWDDMIFTCHNPTISDVSFDMFNPLVVSQVNIPSIPSPSFWIDGSADYGTTVRDFFNSPAWVRRIYFYSHHEENFKQVITHVYKDANGTEVNIPRIPSLSVGINQFQGWIGELDFENDETVFGINQWYQNVLIKANSELTFLVIYKQIDKMNMLSIVSALEGKTICDEYSSCPNKIRKWSEKDLYLNDYTVSSPYKQNMYLGQEEPSVLPFDFSILKK